MFARAFGLCLAVGAAIMLMSASSAALATAPGAASIDVSSRAAIENYLRSIHVDPRGVVIQRGVRNYAGHGCPGKGWTCANTDHPVVQVASAASGSNTFRCSTDRCVVVQVSGPAVTATNTAVCVKTGGQTQACTIVQASPAANNKAVVYESVSSSAGLTQSAKSTAAITQQATGAANANEACVYQAISLNGSGIINKNSVSLAQSAYQTLTIKQDSANGGNSAAESATQQGQCTGASIAQRQTLSSTMTVPKSIIQSQNAASKGFNMTIDIEQNQSTGFLGTAYGQNSATFDQYNSLTAVANSKAGPVSQTQSSLSGGLLGTINQDSRDPSAAVTTQTEIQCEDAAKSGLAACDTSDADASEAPSSLTQTQFGPVNKVKGAVHKYSVHKGAGTSTQTGNSTDTFLITQSSTQDNDQGAGSHQTNTLQGDCSTAGNCTVTQNTSIDGQQTTNTQSGQNVNTTTNCTGSECTGPPVTVLQLNPQADPEGGTCEDGYASGTGFQGVPQEVPESVDLSQFDGQTIELRFSFSTGDTNYNDFEGWYVKNIQVTGTQFESQVTVFSDPVADGDTSFTPSSTFGTAPGWHVTDRRNSTFEGPAWWYGNEETGSYQSPNPANACADASANQGTITSAPFTLASNSQLSFDTLWQIEGVNPSGFDQMDVQVIPVSGGAG